MSIYIKFYRRDWSHDDEPQLGIGWYKHFAGHPYKGFSLYSNMIWFRMSVTFVNDWKAYEATHAKVMDLGYRLFSSIFKRREARPRPDWRRSEFAPFIKKAKKTPLKNKDNI